ncbi:histidine kinase [Runella zeae]|uniref:histidine kinase n=1 Tax=Runella zeae TaxID=94255 RepID=UPI0023535B8C|nr:histidine kinase [Runella zeae]
MNTPLTQGSWSPTKTYHFGGENLRYFRLDSFAGPIELIGWDKEEIHIEIFVTIRRWSTVFLIEEPLAEWEWDEETVSISQADNTLHVRSRPNYRSLTNWLNFPKVSFRVYLPTNISTQVYNSFGGDIFLKSLKGRHQFNTMGGHIKLDNVEGELKGRTTGGNIHFLSCDAKADVSTFGGNIKIEQCKGEIKVSTKGGNIHIRHCEAKIYTDTWGGNIKASHCKGDLKCYTSGGNIAFEEIQGNIGASTKGGNMRVSIKAIDEYLWLEANSGNINIDLPLQQGLQLNVKGSRVKMPFLPNFNGVKKNRYINGQLNGGGANVTLKTQGGVIAIKPYEAEASSRATEEQTAYTENEVREEDAPIPFENRFWTTVLPFMYSFFVMALFVYGFSSVFYFSLELMKTDSPENAQNTALFLLNITSSVGCFVAVNVFIKKVERKYHSDWKKYLILIIMTVGFVRLAHFLQWIIYLYLPDNELFWAHYWRMLDYNVWNTYSDRNSLFFASIPLFAVSLYFYFWQKSRHFTRKISEQEYQLLNLEKLKTKAQLNALEARINPHFLYNSLNSIAGLVHQDPDKAEEMTIQLSKLFRHTTGRNEGHYHLIAEELEVVRSYLAIEQMRFGNRLSFSIKVAPELLDFKIPRFLLQPLVENAIKHGISNLLKNGEIEIIIEDQTDTIQFRIHDNGPAFKEDISGGYGLRSIRDKLNLIYGQKASLQVQNNAYKMVIISIPKQHEWVELK